MICVIYLFWFVGVFHESTIRGLEFYSEEHPQFVETARYLKFISTIWKILSVKAPYKGMLSNFKLSKNNTRVELHTLKAGIIKMSCLLNSI